MWIQQAWVHNALAAHERWKGLLLCGKTKMMNECLEATALAEVWGDTGGGGIGRRCARHICL